MITPQSMPRRSEYVALKSQLRTVESEISSRRRELLRLQTFPITYGSKGRSQFQKEQQLHTTITNLERDARRLRSDVRSYEQMKRRAGFERLNFD
jgi:hypothetical protein